MKSKMKSDNFTMKEVAKGNHDTKYFNTQNKTQHKNLGNPNEHRALIPQGQIQYNRNSRVKFGFETVS